MSPVMAEAFPERISWSVHRQRKSRRQLYYDVVIFDERETYPRGIYTLMDSVFYADDEIAFSVVRGRSWNDLDPELPYTEVSALSLGHMRLIASFLLCEERGGWRFVFYPATPRGLRLNAQRLRLASPDVISEIRELVLARCESERTSGRPRLFRPPGASFNVVNPEDFAIRRLREFFHALNPVNYIVYRGLYALMKADMLACHEEFWEEATIAC